MEIRNHIRTSSPVTRIAHVGPKCFFKGQIGSATHDFAEKCLKEAPDWNPDAMKKDKKKELLRVFKPTKP